MAYLPPVVARLSFDLGDLSAKIDEAKAKIKSLGDTIHIKTDVDNSALRQMAQDAEAIHRMMGRDQAIRERVNLDDADAKARLAALTRDRRVHVRVDVDKSKLSEAEGLFSKLGSLLGGGHSFNLPFSNFTANPIGLAAIGGGIAALLPELAGIVSGFAAAGTGAAAFGALALPSIHAVSQALSSIKKDQLAYNRATTDKQREAALQHLKDDLKGLDPLQLKAVKGIQQLSQEYHKAAKAFEPEAMKVLTGGLKIANDLLPHLTPFANTFADAISKWFTNLDKSSKGKGFQDFLKQFQSISGPALQAITAGIGNVAGSVGRLLTVMSGKDVAHTLNIAFSAISGTIGGLTTTIRFLMNAFDGMKLAGHNVASAFDGIRHAVAGVGHDIAANFDAARHAIASFSPAAIIAKFANIGGLVRGAFSGAASWFSGLWNGARSAVSKAVSFFKGSFDKTKAQVTGVFAGAEAWFSGLWNGARSAVSKTISFLATLPGKIKGVFAGAGGWLTSAGQAIMSGLLSGLESAWGKVASFLSSLAGKIRSLKGPLDYDRIMLYPHGQAIMQGLMGGMRSQVPALEAQLRGITSTIAGIAGNHAAPAGGVDQPIHVHVHLDGREITNAVAQRSVQTQRRTGTNGMTKRTR
jgi:hypothetical protein